MQTQSQIGYIMEVHETMRNNSSQSMLETIGSTVTESDFLRADLLRVNQEHNNTGCPGTLSIFTGEAEVAHVSEVIDNPQLVEERMNAPQNTIDTLYNIRPSATKPEPKHEETFVSMDYSGPQVDWVVGCDCCEIAWERATQGLFKSRKTRESGESVSYTVQNTPSYTDSSFDFTDTYSIGARAQYDLSNGINYSFNNSGYG